MCYISHNCGFLEQWNALSEEKKNELIMVEQLVKSEGIGFN